VCVCVRACWRESGSKGSGVVEWFIKTGTDKWSFLDIPAGSPWRHELGLEKGILLQHPSLPFPSPEHLVPAHSIA
jgi:hypothetical protein